MRISVAGSGHVGLVTGVCLAELGHQVVCVDIDPQKVARILRGEPSIYEEGLEERLKRNLGGRFTATADLGAAVLDSDVTFITVGTPVRDGQIDLSYVRAAARDIGAALRVKSGYHVVVVKSTVVPGSTASVVLPVLEEASGKRAGADFGVVVNPEFLTEGQAIRDFMEPDRIVLGTIDSRAVRVLDDVYAFFRGVPTIHTNLSTAEMIKFASNTLLATTMSFSNEIANICSALGDVDVVDVMEGVHASSYLTVTNREGRRVRAPLTSYLQAGCGFGGSCLPKDVRALVSHGEGLGVKMPLLSAVIEVNEGQPRQVLRTLEKHFTSLAGLRVAVLGLAYKPDTNDVRDSPAFPVIRALLAQGASVKAYDPIASDEARKVLGDAIAYAATLSECVRDVDAVVLLTRWTEFESVPMVLREQKPAPLLVDGRRQVDKRAVARYAGIGL